MPTAQDKAFADYVVGLMQCVGPVRARSMFGGYGLFLEGLMLGLIVNRTLYLKTDDQTLGEFQALGLEPFTYHKQGKPYVMSYAEAPEAVFEAEEAMREWGNKAYGAALRAAARKRKDPS